MKKIFNLFLISFVSIGLTPNLMSAAKNENDLAIMTKFINYNFSETCRVNAGKSRWVWDKTYQSKPLFTEWYIVDFNDYLGKYPTLFNNLYLTFDLTGSQVDINDQKLDPFANHYINYNVIYFAEFQHQNTKSSKEIGKAVSKENSDGESGTYYLDYKYDYSKKIFSYELRMESFAWNEGNGNVNNAGKGTNRLQFNFLSISFDAPY